MGADGNHYSARYFVADPQEPQARSVDFPSPYAEGQLVLADFCADLPGARGKISDRLARSGLLESLGDVLVLRGAGPQFKSRIDSDPDMRSQLPPDHPVLCLFGSDDPSLPPQLQRPHWAPMTELAPSLEDVRSIELHGLLKLRGGILNGPATHYELAGGTHVDTYVRLRNALETPHDCRRAIDWILPELANGCQILLAHRGLSAFQVALEARVRELGWDVEIHSLPRYDQSQGRESHVPVSMEPDESRKQVIIIGVDSRTREGRGEWVREQRLNLSGYAAASKICLVDTTHPAAPGEAFLHLPVSKAVAANCRCCKGSRLPLATVDPDDETLMPTERKREELQVSMPDVKKDEDFWRIVERTSAARVHINQRYEAPNKPEARRHRAFDLDVGRLLTDPVFYSECVEKLGHLRPDDGDCAVLIPDHERAGDLRKLAESALGVSASAVHVVQRLDPTAEIDPAVLDCRHLIILDDMLWTGATVIGIASKLMKRLGIERYARIDVRAFVVLNCATEDRIRGVVSNLTPGSGKRKQRLQQCRRVPLPREREPCPWCSEAERLEGPLRERLQTLHPEYLESRLKTLKELSGQTLSPLADAETLIDTFIGDISTETALVRWASALQVKRGKLGKPSEPQPPAYYVDLSFIAMRWKDWAQCAGILRVASESEVRYALQEDAFKEEWVIKAPDMKLSTLVEFGWAAIEGKLTPPSAELVRKALDEHRGKDPAIAAFADLLEEREPTPAPPRAAQAAV